MRPRNGYTLALLLILVLTTHIVARCSHAHGQSDVPVVAPTQCAPEHPLTINLPKNFERIPSDHAAVICIFRNKIEGFPTLNVVTEPRHEGSQPPTMAEYQEGIKRGYQSVGLSDATLSNSLIGVSNGVPFFTSEVNFTNAGTPMSAQILVVQLHDRTYTVSAVGRASPDSPELKKLIQAIQIDGKPLDLHQARAPSPLVIAGIIAALAALATLLWSKNRSIKRS